VICDDDGIGGGTHLVQVGFVAEGLFYLLIIGIVAFVAALVFLGIQMQRSGQHQRPLR
jgi:hypothetical protein